MKPSYQIISSGLLLLTLLLFGYTNRTTFLPEKPQIHWSERSLNWDDFREVNYIDEGYDASVSTHIVCPDLITDSHSLVYAYMDPNQSERLDSSTGHDPLLAHEQYHFNITEYCARLLRKDLVERGLGGLSYNTIHKLKQQYGHMLDSLQTAYDETTEHSQNVEEQRRWELKLDDLLRQTAYYAGEDIYGYYDFTANATAFYKHIYYTLEQRVLPSYPVAARDTVFGETYQVEWVADTTIIRFRKNGVLFNGGFFNTAITKIVRKEQEVTEHYYGPDGTYNRNLISCIQKSQNKDGSRMEHYLDHQLKEVEINGVARKKLQYQAADSSYLLSYYNKYGHTVRNERSLFHERRYLDAKGRTRKIVYLDRWQQPMFSDDLVNSYELSYDRHHKIIAYQLLADDKLAIHKADYQVAQVFDERGNLKKVISMNAEKGPEYDSNGVSVYEFTYDMYDRLTSEKRFHPNGKPIIGNDDYFHQVFEYDSLGRTSYTAQYYPDYVLKFSDSKWGATRYRYEGDSLIYEANEETYGGVFPDTRNIATIRKRLNQQGLVEEEVYLDADGNYALTADGVAGYLFEYDAFGNKVGMVARDSLGQPTPFDGAAVRQRWSYDTSGNILSLSYEDADTRKVANAAGISESRFSYDANNRRISTAHFGPDGNPAALEGVIREQALLNRFGSDSVLIRLVTGSGEGETVTNRSRFYYNPFGNLIREEYYNELGKRLKDSTGVSGLAYRYDPRQRIILKTNLNEKNRPVSNDRGIAFEKWGYNALGHQRYHAYYDSDKRPVSGPEGYHRKEFSWDPLAELTLAKTYGPEGQLVADPSGIAIYKYLLTPSGRTRILEYYDTEYQLVEDPAGVAVTYYEEDMNGLYFLEKELDARRESVLDSLSLEADQAPDTSAAF